jgi:hypothetical protein
MNRQFDLRYYFGRWLRGDGSSGGNGDGGEGSGGGAAATASAAGQTTTTVATTIQKKWLDSVEEEAGEADSLLAE